MNEMKPKEAFHAGFLRLLEKDYSPSQARSFEISYLSRGQVGLFANEVGSTGQRRCGA